MRVFLADDQSDVRSALRLLLEQEPGMTVMGEAGDALTLLEQAQAQCMDLVLLDWELPGLPATQVINTLRRTCPGTRVVALSGRSGARRAALITGVDAFVSKGDSPTQVLSILRSLNSTTATQRS